MMTDKEFAEMMIEDEHQVQGHPCCANCKHCFVEYGMTNCYYEGEEFVPENYGSSDTICKMWRSDVSGMTHEEYLAERR